jgi:hypothetical protein
MDDVDILVCCFSHPVQEGTGDVHGVAVLPLGASVQNKNLHLSSASFFIFILSPAGIKQAESGPHGQPHADTECHAVHGLRKHNAPEDCHGNRKDFSLHFSSPRKLSDLSITHYSERKVTCQAFFEQSNLYHFILQQGQMSPF